MGLGIRKWIASSISKIDPPELYPLHRWMKLPGVEKETVEPLYGGMGDVSYVDLFFQDAAIDFTGKFFRDTSDENYNLILFPKVKSSPIFFVLKRVKSSPKFFDLKKTVTIKQKISFVDVEYFDPEEFSLILPEEAISYNMDLLSPKETLSHTKELSSPIKYYKVAGLEYNVDAGYWQAKVGDEYFDIELDADYLEAKIGKEYLDIAVKSESLNLLDWGVETVKVNYTFNVPQTKDILSTFVPTIEKIDLLDNESLSFEVAKVIDDAETSLEFTKPEIVLGEFFDMGISTAGSMFYYEEFNFKEGKNYLIKDTALNTSELTTKKHNEVSDFLTDGVHSPVKNLIEDSLSSISLIRHLEPVYELTDALKSDILASLPMYQQEGAEFLFNSDLAFISDDFALSKEYQCILALKMLLRIRAVKSVLIVTTKYKESVRDSRDFNSPKGMWRGGIDSLLENYSAAYHNSINNINSISSFSNLMNIVTYDVLEECLATSKLVPEDLNVFDCIILDDISTDVLKLKLINHLNDSLVCKYFWFLSDFDNPSFISKVKDLFPNKELKTLARERNSATQLSGNVYCDIVIDVDSDNKKIPTELIVEAKAKVGELVFTGNLMRIQPAIFQLVHDSQRKTNFNLNSPDYGNKAKLLKYNIDRILDRYDRLLIYTQFDDSGIQQLSEFLKANDIEFIKFDLSDSAQNVTDKLVKAKSYEGNLVYLTNLKQKGLFFKFPNVSNLINFDNWWNPIARYSIEDNLNKGTEKNLTVYNYYFNNTFEYDLLENLSSLGLKDKNIISSLTTDNFYNIINETLWCKILGVDTETATRDEDEEEVKKEDGEVDVEESGVETEKEVVEEVEVKKDNYPIKSLNDLVKHSKSFLSKLNLTEIKSQVDILNYSSTINAGFTKSDKTINVIVKCVFARNLSSKYIKEIIKDFLEDTESKIFLITSGTIEKPTTILPNNLSLIDGEKLKSYLDLL